MTCCIYSKVKKRTIPSISVLEGYKILSQKIHFSISTASRIFEMDAKKQTFCFNIFSVINNWTLVKFDEILVKFCKCSLK